MMFSKDDSSSGGETLCSSCRFCTFKGYCILDDMYHHKVGVCKDHQEYKEKNENNKL